MRGLNTVKNYVSFSNANHEKGTRMQRYEHQNIYSKTTGKKQGTQHVPVAQICDFCGKELTDEDEGNIQVKFRILEVGGSEETYYYHPFPELKPNIKIDGYKVFSEHPNYVYCTDENGESCTMNMISQYDATNPVNLETLMQESRIRVVVNLLNEGMTPEQMGIQE